MELGNTEKMAFIMSLIFNSEVFGNSRGKHWTDIWRYMNFNSNFLYQFIACQSDFGANVVRAHARFPCEGRRSGIIGANVVRAHERFPCGGRRSGH